MTHNRLLARIILIIMMEMTTIKLKTRLFAGMEAPTVILITKTLGTNETAVRSGMLRAVAKLIVITDSADSNIKNIEQHFDVTRMKDFDSISDSEEES